MNKVYRRFSLVFLFCFFLVSCKDLIMHPVENQWESDTAWLCMKDSSVNARSINPDIKTSDLTYFELYGKRGNEEKRLLGTWKSISAFSSSKVNVSLGVWDFYLTAKVDESSQTVFKAESLNKNIVSGANFLSFSLFPYTYSMGDKGEFQITVRIPCDKVTHATAFLKAIDFDSNENISDTEVERLNVLSASDSGDSKDRIEFFGLNKDSGIYNAVITLYKDDVELNTITSIVNIVDGFVSAGIIDIDDIENIYTIEFELNGGSWVNPLIIPSIYSRNSEIYLPTKNNITLEGYTFDGWYSQVVHNETAEVIIVPSGSETAGTTTSNQRVTAINAGSTGNKKFYAYFKLNTYSIVFDANGGDGIMNMQSSKYTSTLILNANRFNKKGYHFQCWNTKADGTGTTYAENALIRMPLNGLVLYAIWEPNTYTVAFNSNGGSGSMVNQIMTYDSYTTLNANSFTRNGYKFRCWSLDSDGGGLCYSDCSSVKNLTTDNNTTVTLYAQWDYWLTEGDIVLKDGSIRSKSTNLSNAVAVIFRGTTENSPALGFALLTSETANKGYAWAAKNTTGANKNFNTVSDGSANWAVISSSDEQGSLDAQLNYPAFYAAQHFSAIHDMGIYTYGWYLPSKGEAEELLEKYYQNDLSFLPSDIGFYTSSSDSSANAYFWYLAEYDGEWEYDIYSGKRTDTQNILPIRAFGSEYKINYVLDGGFCPEGTPLKHTYGVETSLSVPIRYGFKFEGWYSDSGLTNRVYSISAGSKDVTLYAKWSENFSVGDIILKDGTVVLYNKIGALTSEQRKNAVAVIYKANVGDEPAFGVGLKPKTLKWSSNTSYNFATSETDGRTNWRTIRQTDTTGAEASATNYPAMDYAINYADYCDTGIYKTDWYMPARKEVEAMTILYSYAGPFFNSLEALDVDWRDYEFYSSSQYSKSASYIWSYQINFDYEDDSMSVIEEYRSKTSSYYTLPVRAFGTGNKITYVLNGGTLAEGSPTEHMYGSETKLKAPSKYGYIFMGWYSDSSFSGERKYYLEPEDKAVTLYAKWKRLLDVGDIVLSDGTCVNVNALTDEKRNKAIAVVIKVIDENDVSGNVLAVGLHQEQSGVEWCDGRANANNLYINTLPYSLSSGKNSFSILKEFLTSRSKNDLTESLYPAWFFAENYGGKYGLPATHATGWYLPTISELRYIANNFGRIQNSLVTLGADSFSTSYYWACTQALSSRAMYSAALYVYSGLVEDLFKYDYVYGNDYACVCVLRQFTVNK